MRKRRQSVVRLRGDYVHSLGWLKKVMKSQPSPLLIVLSCQGSHSSVQKLVACALMTFEGANRRGVGSKSLSAGDSERAIVCRNGLGLE